MIKKLITIITSSQVLLLKSILQALIKVVDLGDPYYGGNLFMQLVLKNLPKELADYTVFLLAFQRVMHQIHHQQEDAAEFPMVMRI